MPELKTKLKEYRAKLDMKQGDLAEKVGVRRETIIRLEKGQYSKQDGLQVFDAEEKHRLKMQIQTYKHIF